MVFKMRERELLFLICQVLATTQEETVRIWFASDVREPLILHWGVSKLNKGEWQVIFENRCGCHQRGDKLKAKLLMFLATVPSNLYNSSQLYST